MRIRWVVLTFAAVLLGAIAGAMLAPQPAGAVSRDMIELQQQVAQLLQGQQDMRSAMDSNNATIKTLVQQSLDSVNKLSAEMSSVQNPCKKCRPTRELASIRWLSRPRVFQTICRMCRRG